MYTTTGLFIILVAVLGALAVIPAFIAKKKGYSFGWFLAFGIAGFFLVIPVVFLVTLALPRRYPSLDSN